MRWWATWPLVLALAAPVRAAAQPIPGTETLVAGGPGNQTEPAIAYPRVAYTDYGSVPSRVCYYDANKPPSNRACAPALDPARPGAQTAPAIAGGVIAYAEGAFTDAKVVLYDIVGGGVSAAALPDPEHPGMQAHPGLSQRLVAWEDGRSLSTLIRVRDFLNGELDVPGPGPQAIPRVSGALVVYVDLSFNRSIKLYDVGTPPVAPVLIHPGPAESASVDSDQGVVVVARLDPGDIEVRDVSGNLIKALGMPGVNPHVSGEWVAFEDLSTNTSRVILWNWKPVQGRLYAPTAGSSVQKLNALEVEKLNARVVYADNRNGDYDVFMYETASVPPPPPDGGTDGGSDGGTDGGSDGGTDGGSDGGVDGGIDGGADGGSDGGVDGGADGGADGGTDGGPDGGSAPASCDDANATVLAELVVDRVTAKPHARNVDFRVPCETQVLVCIDPDRVSSAWVLLDDEAIATPRDFNPNVTHLERRREVEEGTNRLGAVIAGKPGASISVRVLLDPRGKDREEHEDDGDGLDRGGGEGDGKHETDERARRAREAKERSRQELGSAAEVPPQGCGTTGAGLLGVPALAWLGRRRRGGPARPS